MKPLISAASLAALFAAGVWAADFWQSKPFTDWSDKDVQKMLQNSPWSKQFTVVVSGGPNNGSRGGRRAGSQVSDDSSSSGGRGMMNGPASGDTGSVNPGTSRYPSGDPGATSGASLPTMDLIVRWQSALAVREAIVRAKYKGEAATSQEARQALETPIDHYIIAVGGLPRIAVSSDPDGLKKQMIAQAVLLIKGRDPIHPVDFMTKDVGRNAEAMFAFPKTQPISADDREVEFIVRIADYNIRERFRLKDMVINGKLDL